jgi:hypothetical protein
VVAEDGETEQLVVLRLDLEKPFKAGVSSRMKIWMRLLVVDRENLTIDELLCSLL